MTIGAYNSIHFPPRFIYVSPGLGLIRTLSPFFFSSFPPPRLQVRDATREFNIYGNQTPGWKHKFSPSDTKVPTTTTAPRLFRTEVPGRDRAGLLAGCDFCMLCLFMVYCTCTLWW